MNSAFGEGGITTCPRIAALLSQLAQETTEFLYWVELGDGSNYEGGCYGYGNCQPGDGPKYKGRGPIQLTGRYNYQTAGDALGLDLINNPEWAARPEYGFRIALWYWNSHNLSPLADQNTESSLDAITQSINGCLECYWTNKVGRRGYWTKGKQVLGC